MCPFQFSTDPFSNTLKHYAWTYVAGKGRNTKVGLYHSSSTGHLMIYAGKKIVTIDFKVLDTKEYTFFIDEELCKIKLERRGGKMFYFFEIDKKADTPLNRTRWAREKKHLWQMLASFGTIVLLVAGVLIWSKSNGRNEAAENRLAHDGIETYGKVTSLPGKNGGGIRFQFIAGDGPQEGKLDGQILSRPLPPNKFPVEIGDEFVVKYMPGRPGLNRIYLMRPTARQMDVYRERALQNFINAKPGISPGRAKCFLEIAHEMDGLDGWAQFYFLQTPPRENPHHNSETFQKYINGYLFQGEAEKRCPPK